MIFSCTTICILIFFSSSSFDLSHDVLRGHRKRYCMKAKWLRGVDIILFGVRQSLLNCLLTLGLSEEICDRERKADARGRARAGEGDRDPPRRAKAATTDADIPLTRRPSNEDRCSLPRKGPRAGAAFVLRAKAKAPAIDRGEEGRSRAAPSAPEAESFRESVISARNRPLPRDALAASSQNSINFRLRRRRRPGI
jgi:hypothetical protein